MEFQKLRRKDERVFQRNYSLGGSLKVDWGKEKRNQESWVSVCKSQTGEQPGLADRANVVHLQGRRSRGSWLLFSGKQSPQKLVFGKGTLSVGLRDSLMVLMWGHNSGAHWSLQRNGQIWASNRGCLFRDSLFKSFFVPRSYHNQKKQQVHV